MKVFSSQRRERLLTALALSLIMFVIPAVAQEANYAKTELNWKMNLLPGASEKKEKFAFKTEVSRVMNIIIHSLYKNKDIFLRELISNASDALDKIIRILSLSNKELLKDNSHLRLTIKADPAANTLIITDTGIGMTPEHLKNNLGTIAKSGTADFLKAFEEKAADTSNLIGQFGVGFYSAFLVADKVVVVSKHNEDEQHIWESSTISDYSIVKDPRGNTLGRGTQIILHLKDDAKEFLEPAKIQELIAKYSEFIDFPIHIWSKYNVTEELDETTDTGDNNEDGEDKETKKEDGKKTVEKEVEGFRLVNVETPIWTRDPKTVTPEQHKALFHKLNGHIGEPLDQIHFRAEGESNFKAILYVPKLGFEALKMDKFSNTPIKLYVKKVFITDDTVKLLPDWLSFLRGIVDCDDISLNVSRETVQNSRIVRIIKKKLLNKAFELFASISADPTKNEKFMGDFGPSLKRGIREDEYNQERIAKLLSFPSSSANATTLDQYIGRMKKEQKRIYFITGGSMGALRRSPYVEKLVSQGHEVLYMDQPVDEYTMQHLRKYKKFELVHAIAAKDDVKEDKKELAALEKEFKPLLDWFTKILSKDVESVKLSTRLIYSPTAITPASLGGLSGNQERLLKAQAYASKQEIEINSWLNAKKGLELNPNHIVIKSLLDKKSMTDFHAALRLRPPSPQAYADRVEKLIRAQLGLSTTLDYPELNSKPADPASADDDENFPEVEAEESDEL
ncbi:hypothetical protein L0F63_005014 [Massospora cicadina]|nr:hypothetical protein L0F63_005014 [Massospora cicadina]